MLIGQNKEYPALWFKEQVMSQATEGKSSADIPCCPLEKVIRCDEHYLTGYRNKVEFTIGRSFSGSVDK